MAAPGVHGAPDDQGREHQQRRPTPDALPIVFTLCTARVYPAIPEPRPPFPKRAGRHNREHETGGAGAGAAARWRGRLARGRAERPSLVFGDGPEPVRAGRDAGPVSLERVPAEPSTRPRSRRPRPIWRRSGTGRSTAASATSRRRRHRTRSTATASSSALASRRASGRRAARAAGVPDSPASEAGLARGDSILEIDGRSVAVLVVAPGQIGTAFGASEIGVSSEILFRSLAGVERRQRMTKRPVTIPTVSLTRAFDVDGRRSAICSSATSSSRPWPRSTKRSPR